MTVELGAAVDQTVLDRRLAQGGMGEAFLAHHARTGDAVVKLLAEPLLGGVASHARFVREGEALRRLDRPGVQHLVARATSGLRPYLVLEYVAGETLRERLRRGPLGTSEALRLGQALAQTLTFCHRRGVVHRDLKRDNVVLAAGGRPVLIDLGSALLEGARRLTFQALTPELGMPEYMAPEQVQGQRGDARTDVYALGLVLYEALAGRGPFAAPPGERPLRTMQRHLDTAPAPLEAPGLDDATRGVVALAMDPDPARRFESMGAFAAALAAPRAAVARGEVVPGWAVAATPAAARRWHAAFDDPRSAADRLRCVAVFLATVAALVAVGALATCLRLVTGT